MDAYLQRLFDAEVEIQIEEGQNRINIDGKAFAPSVVLNTRVGSYDEVYNRWRKQHKENLLSKADDILSDSNNLHSFSLLKHALAQGTVMPFVGAGMSCSAGLEPWGKFLSTLKRNTNNVDTGAYIALRDNNDYIGMADLLAQAVGPNRLWIQICQRYQLLRGDVEGAVNYLPTLFKSGVVTTNYDNVLETIYTIENIKFDPIIHGVDSKDLSAHLSQGENFLYKIHGTFDDPQTRVFTRKEYDTVYKDQVFLDNLTQLYEQRTLLFLGCSLDRDEALKHFKVLTKAKPHKYMHYAFLPYPEDEGGDADWLRNERDEELASHGISPIWYKGDHDESLCGLLEKLLS